MVKFSTEKHAQPNNQIYAWFMPLRVSWAVWPRLYVALGKKKTDPGTPTTKFAKSQQLTSRSGADVWDLLMPNFQISLSDITKWKGITLVDQVMVARVTSPRTMGLLPDT